MPGVIGPSQSSQRTWYYKAGFEAEGVSFDDLVKDGTGLVIPANQIKKVTAVNGFNTSSSPDTEEISGQDEADSFPGTTTRDLIEITTQKLPTDPVHKAIAGLKKATKGVLALLKKESDANQTTY